MTRTKGSREGERTKGPAPGIGKRLVAGLASG